MSSVGLWLWSALIVALLLKMFLFFSHVDCSDFLRIQRVPLIFFVLFLKCLNSFLVTQQSTVFWLSF